MPVYDPRVLSQALDDLIAELARWSSVATDTRQSADYTQRQDTEIMRRTVHAAQITLHQAQDDADLTARTLQHAENLATTCEEAVGQGQATLHACDRSRRDAASCQAHWNSELAKALAWLERAKARLARAITALEAAVRALNAAINALNSAIDAYNRCMNDDDRRNCNGEAARVRGAQAEVDACRERVRLCEIEVEAAKREVAAAEARVACCREAVSQATAALALADRAVQDATDALSSAERAADHARATRHAAAEANTRALLEVETAEAMVGHAAISQRFVGEAQECFARAERREQACQRNAGDARRELQYRLEQLIELNRPLHNVLP